MKSMNIRAKIISIIGIFCIFFALTACQKKVDNAESLSQFSIDSEKVKDVTLSVYAPQGANTDLMKMAVERYNKLYDTNIKVNYTNVPLGAPTTQMLSPRLVAHEVMPEIVMISDQFASGILQLFSESFLKASDFGFYEKYGDQFFSPKVETLTNISPNKETYAFPMDVDIPITYYRDDLFNKVNMPFETLKSWDDLIEAGKKIKEETGTNLITVSQTGESDLIEMIMDQQDVSLFDEDGNTNLASPAAKNAAEIVQKMVDADLVQWSSPSNTEKNYKQSAVIMKGAYYMRNMEKNFPDQKGLWKISKFIPYSESNPGKSPNRSGSGWYITKDSKNPTAAAQILTFMLTDPEVIKFAVENGVKISNKNAYTDEVKNITSDFFGGQKTYSVLADAFSDIGVMNIFPNFADARTYISTASYSYWQSKDFDESYNAEAERFAKKYSIKVNH